MAWDFHSLFQMHAGGIRRSLRRRGFDGETAGDLTQDTFVRVMTAQPESDGREHLTRAYLYKVARNLGINHAKRQSLFTPMSLDEPDAQPALAREPDTESIVVTRDQLRLVRTILLDLPPRHRQAFLLHRIENWTVARIADHMGISSTRAWELIHASYRQIILRTGGL